MVYCLMGRNPQLNCNVQDDHRKLRIRFRRGGGRGERRSRVSESLQLHEKPLVLIPLRIVHSFLRTLSRELVNILVGHGRLMSTSLALQPTDGRPTKSTTSRPRLPSSGWSEKLAQGKTLAWQQTVDCCNLHEDKISTISPRCAGRL